VAYNLLNAIFSFGGVLMSGYSYFNYDQMTIFDVEVHSDELELLKQAADEYDWEVRSDKLQCNVG